MKYTIKGKKIDGNWILKKLYYGGFKDLDLLFPADRYKEIKNIVIHMKSCEYIEFYSIDVPNKKRGFRVKSKKDGLNYIQDWINIKERKWNYRIMWFLSLSIVVLTGFHIWILFFLSQNR